MKILLAVDGSAYTKKMLAYLATHPELIGSNAEVTVFHSPLPVPPRVVSVLGAKMVRDSYRDAAQAVFGPIEKFLLRHGVEAKYQFQAGPAAAGIAKVAKQGGFDLIIMGSHGSGGLKNLIMGSVATSVLAQCDTPVLLVR